MLPCYGSIFGMLGSARAYYRLLLYTAAPTRSELAHKLYETPLEYERRLRPQVQPMGTGPERPADLDPQ